MWHERAQVPVVWAAGRLRTVETRAQVPEVWAAGRLHTVETRSRRRLTSWRRAQCDCRRLTTAQTSRPLWRHWLNLPLQLAHSLSCPRDNHRDPAGSSQSTAQHIIISTTVRITVNKLLTFFARAHILTSREALGQSKPPPSRCVYHRQVATWSR